MDKTLVKTLRNIDRPFSFVEAMFSYSVDVDCGKENTLRGYAKLWGWSVGKVRRFVECLRNTNETVVERKGNGSGTVIRFVCNELQALVEQSRNSSGTVAEHKRDATIILNPNPNPKKIKTFSSDSSEYRLSLLLFNEIKNRNENHKKPNLQSWAKDIDKMMRLDSRGVEEIKKVIIWCQKDSFWQNNILSTAKLRDKFDQLVLKMNSNGQENEKGWV